MSGQNLGNFAIGSLITLYINAQDTTGAGVAPVSLAASVYKGTSVTESTTGVSAVTATFDARTGLSVLTVDTSADGTFYSAASDFWIIGTAGTANGISAVGKILGFFSLENRVSKADIIKLLGTAWLTPAVAGTPDVNSKQIGGTVQSTGDLSDLIGTLTTNVAAVAANVWSVGTRSLTTFGTLTTDTATAVWANAGRTLTGFGTLVSDIWANATRTLSGFGFTVATNSDSNITAIKAKTDLIPAIPATEGNVTAVGTSVLDVYNRIGVAGVGLTNLGDTRLANLDASILSRMATYAQPTGFLGATFSGTIASVGSKMDIVDAPSTAGKLALANASRDAVWNATGTGFVTVGSMGYIVQNISGGGGGGGFVAVPTNFTLLNIDSLGRVAPQPSSIYVVSSPGNPAGTITGQVKITNTNPAFTNLKIVLYPDGSDTGINITTGITRATNQQSLFNFTALVQGLHSMEFYDLDVSATIPLRFAWIWLVGGQTQVAEDSREAAILSAGTGFNVETLLTYLTDTLTTYLGNTVGLAAPAPPVGPVLNIVLGDDYYGTDSRTVTLYVTGVMPDWALTAVLNVTLEVNHKTVTVPGTIVDYTGTNRQITFDLPRASSQALGTGTGLYYARLTLADGHIMTIVDEGELTIVK